MFLFTVTATDKTDNTQYVNVFTTSKAAVEYEEKLRAAIPARCQCDWDIRYDFCAPDSGDELLGWMIENYKDEEE